MSAAVEISMGVQLDNPCVEAILNDRFAFARTLLILRGAPGCGKTTFACVIQRLSFPGSVIVCSADDYMVDKDGSYQFAGRLLETAHKHCFAKATAAMSLPGIRMVIIANTNSRPSDFHEYETEAARHGFIVFHVIVENRHGGVSEHGVPEETVEKFRNRIKGSMVL